MFKLVNTDSGAMPRTVKLTAGDATYAVGTALYIVSGLLEIATGNVKATHICEEDKTIASTGDLLCYEITPQMTFECPIEDIDATYHAVGLAAQFHTDGAQITDAAAGSVYVAATSGGAVTTALAKNTGALIVDMRGAAADGDVCWVKLNY